MRRYIAKILIPLELQSEKVGYVGERLFKMWWRNNFHDEPIFKQKADREYQQIDFSDSKGYTYQVKTTSKKSYTFNCNVDKIKDHLNADFYIFIQLKEHYAYLETIYKKEYVLTNIKKSWINDTCYVKARDLQQQEIDIR